MMADYLIKKNSFIMNRNAKALPSPHLTQKFALSTSLRKKKQGQLVSSTNAFFFYCEPFYLDLP